MSESTVEHDRDARDQGPDTDDDSNQGGSHQGDSQQHRRKRQRVRLSCLECRRRKLSCSRELPCDRCLKSGTPDRCTYESRPGGTVGPPPSATIYPSNTLSTASAGPIGDRVSFPHNDVRRPVARRDIDPSLRDATRDHDRIRRLELEVAQLRGALSKQASLDGTTIAASPSTLKDGQKESPPEPFDVRMPSFLAPEKPGDGLEYKFIKGSNFKTRFCGVHKGWSSFRDLVGIDPFMRETAEEWLRPLNIQRKDRKKRREDREQQFLESDSGLEALLPPKDETDSLITVYLEQFEQVHRIIHIPTFKKEYAKFWDPMETRCAAFTALVLAMLAAASCLDMQASSKFVGVKSSAFQTAEKLARACDAWLDRQSHKHRRMIHYQIICMLYLAKRVNVIKKKRFWTTSGAIVRDGIVVGLHRDGEAASSKITPYYREMRRRIWATMVEFDVQSSFDQGVPTILSQMNIETKAPTNIDDDDFNEDSEELPLPKPSTEYTFSSYQNLSRQSLQLRLELDQIISSSVTDLDWEQVTRYTEMINQEIDSLPPWDSDEMNTNHVSHKPLLVYTLLHVQLKQYLIPLHQPFLKLRQYNSKYQVAEFIFYSAARDIVLMHDRLFQKGIRALYFLREDTLNAAVNLCNVSLRQPKGEHFQNHSSNDTTR
jgi:hypothetical protein